MKMIRLHHELYDSVAISRAITAYQQLCSIQQTEEESYITLVFEHCVVDEQRTVQEFCNMALMETIRTKGVLHD